MSNILFRAKRKYTGEWAEGYYTYYPNGFLGARDANYIIRTSDSGSDELCVVTPETLSQSTGLKDKNGKMIWENDTVKCEKRGSTFSRCRVIWNNRCGRFDVVAMDGFHYPLISEYIPDSLSVYSKDYEVIDDSDKDVDGLVEGIIKTLQGRKAAAINHEGSVILKEAETEVVITVINILSDMVHESHCKTILEKENTVGKTFDECYEECFRK